MAIQSQQTAPTPTEREEKAPKETSRALGSNSVRAAALDAGGSGFPRGGTRYTIVRGDTLWAISERNYGHGRHWEAIMRSNPGAVFRGGDLILVGDMLDLPVIRVPEAGLTAATTPEATTVTCGGECPAVQPREICTEYGNFRIYPDDFAGDLPTSPDDAQNVRESECEALVAEREREANAQAERTVGEVDSLLSYGAIDWAITDPEARAALAKLAVLPMRQLQTITARVNAKRLLENLPSDTYGTEAFCKVAIALGPEAIQPFLADLSSYGLFDWAVTDADANAVMAVLRILPGAQQGAILPGLGRPMQMRFLELLPARGSALSAAGKVAVKAIFDGGGTDMEILTLAFEVRFNIDVRGDTAEWEELGLAQCWTVLEALPPAHVEGNPELLAWIRRAGSIGGSYGNEVTPNSAKLRYDPAVIATTKQKSTFDDNQDGTITGDERDPLHGVNRFNKVVRHEVGHAVDEQIGGVAGLCLGNEAGGGWTDYAGDSGTAIDDMITASNAGIAKAPAAAKTAIVAQIKADAGADATLALANVQALAEYTAMTADEKAAVDGDPVFTALTEAVDNPWYNHLPNGGTPLSGRIFQKSYASQWTAYTLAARDRKVSQYQFRAPGEWFAEAYAAYYEPNADGTCDHHVLSGRDAAARTWFDGNVDGVAGTR